MGGGVTGVAGVAGGAVPLVPRSLLLLEQEARRTFAPHLAMTTVFADLGSGPGEKVGAPIEVSTAAAGWGVRVPSYPLHYHIYTYVHPLYIYTPYTIYAIYTPNTPLNTL